MGEIGVTPEFARGEMVTYRDRHDRVQVGEVWAIEATWRFGPEPLVIYTVAHPSYAGRRHYLTRDRILSAPNGRLKPPPHAQPPT